MGKRLLWEQLLKGYFVKVSFKKRLKSFYGVCLPKMSTQGVPQLGGTDQESPVPSSNKTGGWNN